MELDPAAFAAFKRQFVEWTGLARDVLHVYLGLALTAIAGIPRRIRPWDFRVLLFPLGVALVGEGLDIANYLAGGAPAAEWASESAKDLLNTLLVPTLMVMMIRTTRPQDS